MFLDLQKKVFKQLVRVQILGIFLVSAHIWSKTLPSGHPPDQSMHYNIKLLKIIQINLCKL